MPALSMCRNEIFEPSGDKRTSHRKGTLPNATASESVLSLTGAAYPTLKNESAMSRSESQQRTE